MRDNFNYKGDDFDLYISEEQISSKIKELSNDINVSFKYKNPIFLGVLSGCIYFMMDLLKEIDFDYEIDFSKINSYSGMNQREIKSDIIDFDKYKNRDVIIVEDIIDSGKTLNYLYEKINQSKPLSITVVTLLKKKDVKSFKNSKIDYFGFEIKNKYVIGYGLDINNLFRNLKDIYIKNG